MGQLLAFLQGFFILNLELKSSSNSQFQVHTQSPTLYAKHLGLYVDIRISNISYMYNDIDLYFKIYTALRIGQNISIKNNKSQNYENWYFSKISTFTFIDLNFIYIPF